MLTYLASRSFFFQAEDGIRYWSVTGVQTCALPISLLERRPVHARAEAGLRDLLGGCHGLPAGRAHRRRAGARSEERRVGEESRSRWSTQYFHTEGCKVMCVESMTVS